MIALAVILTVLVGVSLGLLGGGGSILMVPLLAYVAGMDSKQAIATSLLVVGVTSAVGAISHARAHRVQWRTALVFGGAGTLGAFAGSLTGRFIPGSVLLIGFAVMMVATGVAMVRGRRAVDPTRQSRGMPVAKALALGAGVGAVTGLVGAGGGFLIVPALALLGGLSMPMAVGTSLIVIAMNSIAGFGGQLTAVALDWRLAGILTAAAVVGVLGGALLTSKLNPDVLRGTFGWFVLAMSSVVLAQEVHPAVGIAVAAVIVAAGAGYACRRAPNCPLRHVTVSAAARPAH
jgi:uncharacterized protein